MQSFDRRTFMQLTGSAALFSMTPGKGLFANDVSSNAVAAKEYPFIFGAQYYRAPTPEPELWAGDLKRMNELGFTDVKFWVQWRWSHKTGDKYFFDDLDKLMDLASQNKLRVTLNTIFDVSPHWLFEKYPDAKQIKNNGHVIEPYIVGHRQLGGHPGPCYNHPGALEERKKFMNALVSHFSKHKALAMWDVWNEPELSFPQRHPSVENLACYCSNCQKAFKEQLKQKYASLEELNKIWGRCYENWDQVEVPRSPDTFRDFIDWREFHIDTMTKEAKWRLETVKDLDPERIRYLHVVPNTMQPFNAVSTCADDFEMAKMCDVFAATMNAGPFFTPQVMSAGRGKICYNVESHINGGSTNAHQAIIDFPDLLNDFIPQIGLGIKGFLFWQYRPEVLGFESPAWGLTDLEGKDRPVTKAAQKVINTIAPIKADLMKSFPKPAEIGIWKSNKNEIFHFCINQNLDSLANGVNAYAEAAYWNSYNYCFINSSMLENGDLAGVKLLIMPSCYYVTDKEAVALNAWVNKGGIVITEAHLAAYNGTTGRHSRVVPGGGLAGQWGIKEVDSSSSWRLKVDQKGLMDMNLPEDTKKLLKDFGVSGAKNFPITLTSGNVVWGSLRYTKLDAPGAEPLAYFHKDKPCIVQKKIGKGTVIYCGTNIGEGSEKDKKGFMEIFNKALKIAGISPNLETKTEPGRFRVDSLYADNKLKFITIRNNGDKAQNATISIEKKYKGIFSNTVISPNEEVKIESGFSDLFVEL